MTNFRHYATQVWDACKDEVTWYGYEQEFTILENYNKFSKWPLGWPKDGYPGPQGPYYCSVGNMTCFGRSVSDMHYRYCLAAGVKISGTNAEVMPGQWEFQVGPCVGVESGDQIVIAVTVGRLERRWLPR